MRWFWQRSPDGPDRLVYDPATVTPEEVQAIVGAAERETPAYGSWRIEKDPHAEKFDCQRYGYGISTVVGEFAPLANAYGPRWVSKHTVETEEAARAWIEAEKLRPIIVAEIEA